MSIIFGEFKEKDIEVIKKQLKTKKVNIAGIIERCKWGFPSVVLLHPIRRSEDFNDIEDNLLDYISISNLIWLTCPFLNDKIHKLESDGYIKKITGFIYSNREYSDKMRLAHAHYYYLRKKIYRHFLGEVSSLDVNKKILNAGIGGISKIDTLKCLHLHYTHFRICKENLTGRITYQLLAGRINCKNNICGAYC